MNQQQATIRIADRYDIKWSSSGAQRSSRKLLVMWLIFLLPVVLFGVRWFMLRDRTVFWAGNVSTAHQFIRSDCRRCHTKSWRPAVRLVTLDSAFRSVSDSACQACHGQEKDDHHSLPSNQPVRDCVLCHQEHRGKNHLSRVVDQHCLECHARLTANHPSAETFDPSIRSFADHPEFAVWRADDFSDSRRSAHGVWAVAEKAVRATKGEPIWQDRAKLVFNHDKHLHPNGVPVPWNSDELSPGAMRKLQCVDCHQPDGDGRYMKPIVYEQHCAECHPLSFSGKLSGDPLPHEQPDEVRAVMRERLMEYALQHPEQLEARRRTSPRLPNKSREPLTAKDRWTWVQELLAQEDNTVFRSVKNGCAHCHHTEETDARPERSDIGFHLRIVPPEVPDRWLVHSRFRHDRHRILKCVDCHSAAATSDSTTDILLPSIDVCRKCHGAQHQTSNAARADCVECHGYHHSKPFEGRSLLQLLTSTGEDRLKRASNVSTLAYPWSSDD